MNLRFIYCNIIAHKTLKGDLKKGRQKKCVKLCIIAYLFLDATSGDTADNVLGAETKYYDDRNY